MSTQNVTFSAAEATIAQMKEATRRAMQEPDEAIEQVHIDLENERAEQLRTITRQAEAEALKVSTSPAPTPIALAPKAKLFDENLFRATVPEEMLKARRWMRWFLKPKAEGGYAKIPLGSHTDHTTWDTFSNCVAKLEPHQGLGYCLYGADIHCLDIDHCRNAQTRSMCPEASVLLQRLNSWSEYSVSGTGVHIFFKGSVRGKELHETCLQYWNPKNSPRFIAMTCKQVGAYDTLRDVGSDFNYIFATAGHTSAKIREELEGVDRIQWDHLPPEHPDLQETREKPKHKTQIVCKDFDVKDLDRKSVV